MNNRVRHKTIEFDTAPAAVRISARTRTAPPGQEPSSDSAGCPAGSGLKAVCRGPVNLGLPPAYAQMAFLSPRVEKRTLRSLSQPMPTRATPIMVSQKRSAAPR